MSYSNIRNIYILAPYQTYIYRERDTYPNGDIIRKMVFEGFTMDIWREGRMISKAEVHLCNKPGMRHEGQYQGNDNREIILCLRIFGWARR